MCTKSMLLLSAAAVLVLTVAAQATMTEEKAFTCPLSDTKFTGRVLSSANTAGGIDSDFCAWALGESPLRYEVQVCPECFYARRNQDFDKALASTTKDRLTQALANWRTKHPDVKKVDEVTPAQRWELAAICAIVSHNQPEFVGDLWLRAAWATRHTGLAGLNLKLGTPMDAFEQLDGMVFDLEGKKGKDLVEGTFGFVMLAHRVGEAKRRDAAVLTLEKMTLADEQKKHLVQLKQAFADEAVYQERAIAEFRRAIDTEVAKADRVSYYLYLIGDMNRRLGKSAEALKYYKEAQSAAQVRADVRDMCGFMIQWLEAK